ncbi:MAG: hypothetical protein K0R18_123 [Bacillales bacterium]|jgi:hypothetical protein|nr:hypothetical protein [Bacillales bacterium]
MTPGKITLKNFSGKRIDGIITNQPIEISQQYMEAVAEAVLQVLYNMGTYSNIELNYDLEVEGGTKYYVHGTDVTVVPTTQDPYNRRIRNNPNVISKDRKDDNVANELQKIERNRT